MIVKRKSGFFVVSKANKTLGGPFKTRAAASNRLGQIEFFSAPKRARGKKR